MHWMKRSCFQFHKFPPLKIAGFNLFAVYDLWHLLNIVNERQ